MAFAKSKSESQEAATPDIQLSPQDSEFAARSDTAENFVFKQFPRELGGSMKTSFWGWGGLAFGLGMGLTAGLHPLDDDLQNSFEANALFGKTGNDIIGWTLSPYTIGGVSFFTWVAAAHTGHPKLSLTTKAMTEAILLSMSIDAIAKVSFRRERPDGGNFSFPSGHATAAFAAAGVLTTFYGWKAGVPSYALASLVSISRIDSDKHFLSDVVMGAVLGSVIGIGTARWHKKENPNFFLTPQVTRDHASLGFTYLF